MKVLQEIINTEANYLESVGRQDKQGVVRVARGESAGAVVRLCLWRNA